MLVFSRLLLMSIDYYLWKSLSFVLVEHHFCLTYYLDYVFLAFSIWALQWFSNIWINLSSYLLSVLSWFMCYFPCERLQFLSYLRYLSCKYHFPLCLLRGFHDMLQIVFALSYCCYNSSENLNMYVFCVLLYLYPPPLIV